MTTPKLYKIENTECYLSKDIFNYDRAFFIGISSVRMREIIIKKKLQLEDYLFGLELSNGTIIKKDQTLRKAQLFLTKEYVENNVPKFKNTITKTDYKYEIAPSELNLTDEEKFKDENGNIINIEVRGERKHDKCYFKIEDVSKGFEIPRLYDSLIDKTGNYKINTHYKYFGISIVDKTRKDVNDANTTTIQKKLYLTYLGILKVLFCSRTGTAEKFQDWACEKLFTIQMGEDDDKIKLSSKMIGMNFKTLKHLLGCNSFDKTPCVYLFSLSSANKLLDTDKYKENDIVCKFGYTKDLKERFETHQIHYKKEFKNIDSIELITFSIVDVFHLSAAESKLYTLFEDKKLEYKNEQELIILDKTKINKIKEHYNMIQKTYIGSYQELYDQINILKQQLKDKDNELKDKDNEINLIKEIHTRELLEEKNKLILKDKEIELQNIKYENNLLTYKVKLLENGIKIN
jgi:hypothetical protein